MAEFTTPSRDSIQWSNGNHPLWRYYGAIPAGITVYKDGTGWHIAQEGHDPDIITDSLIVYRGGRVYQLTLAEYNEVVAFLNSQGYGLDPDVYPGFYLGPQRYLGPEAYLGVPV